MQEEERSDPSVQLRNEQLAETLSSDLVKSVVEDNKYQKENISSTTTALADKQMIVCTTSASGCEDVAVVEVVLEKPTEAATVADVSIAMKSVAEDTALSQSTIETPNIQQDVIGDRSAEEIVNVVESKKVETLQEPNIIAHVDCLARQEEQRRNYEQQLEQLSAALIQKDNMILLFQRENAILEKEKQAFRKEKEFANKEKEATVIKFAMKEKLLLDAKKEKDAIEKQLGDAKKEIKNVSIRFQTLNEEKSRITHIMDEKCNEVRKYQRECEKLKTDCVHLESKLKYHINKLNMEVEAKMNLEKKLEEERNAPSKLEEKTAEQLKIEHEAHTILLKHDIENKNEMLETLTKENHKLNETIKHYQENLSKEIAEKSQICTDLELLQVEHNAVQVSYSDEMLNSAKLRGQLEELQVLKTQNTLNEEKICDLNAIIQDLKEKLDDNAHDLKQLHDQEKELLCINKEMSESIVSLQNEISLLRSKSLGIEAENAIFKKEQLTYNAKYDELEKQLQLSEEQRAEERHLMTKHLSEKTKLYEMMKMKLETVTGDFEATKIKNTTLVKELQRELQKYKKAAHPTSGACNAQLNSQNNSSGLPAAHNGYNSEHSDGSTENHHTQQSLSRVSALARRPSESSESETVASNATIVQNDIQALTKKHLVERILRLQQASARQTEKIDFLENHTLSLVAELQKKSKVVQYYMLRDQAGALTSMKSDQNKSDLAKYGNGVMSAIYSGIKGENKSMTLELSLEINRKLQAVLEDTLLKNITLKENLDVLGLEVDNLTKKLRQLEATDRQYINAD